jgi:hypothetical protein
MVDRKKPGVAFWAAVVVAVALLYPLSFGPACWLADRDLLPDRLTESIYRPLVFSAIHTNCLRGLEWYGTLMGLPELTASDEEPVTDCRLYTAVRIRLNAETIKR